MSPSDRRRLGALEVSPIGLGCNAFGGRIDAAASMPVVEAALEAGITHFDTADAYDDGGSEWILGRAIASCRSDVVVATKFGAPTSHGRGAAPSYVRAALARSLERLQTDHVDLYYLHVPDAEVPIGATLECIAELRSEGLVREFGCSNLDAAALIEANRVGARLGVPIAALQNRLNVLDRADDDDGRLTAERMGVAYVPYWPLAKGALADRPGAAGLSRYQAAAPQLEVLREWAARRRVSPLRLALGWLLARPAVSSVICGASRPEQVRANVGAADDPLGPDDLESLDDLVRSLDDELVSHDQTQEDRT